MRPLSPRLSLACLLTTLLFACADDRSVVGGVIADASPVDVIDAPSIDAAPDVTDVVQPVRCSPFERNCGGLCTDVGSDRTNCGGCARACPGEQVCFAGTCQDRCAEMELLCGNRCTDSRFDPLNCGACGNRCPLGQVCNAGRCAMTCDGAGEGITECRIVEGERYCADTRNDRRNCGMCGTLCPLGQTCLAGSCQIACPPGQTNCAGTCRNLRSENEHCGMCGNRCPDGQVCSAGACSVSCAAPLVACGEGAARRCVDQQVDPSNCGMCGQVCLVGQACRAGRCETVCPPGQTLCAGVCRDLQSDSVHCGMCGQACGEGEVCRAGACTITCPTSFTVCAPPAGGRAFCAELPSDPRNCGMCSNVCLAGQSCVSGVCMLVCRAPQIACDAQCRDPQTDNAHCGACGVMCPAGQACAMGRCTVTCPGAQAACEMMCRDLSTDAAHCGACGSVCSRPANASSGCAMGRCVSACNAGFGDCDLMAANGCEADLRASVAHCGACGGACAVANATPACVNGECTVGRCDSGRGDCDGMASNGCEVDTQRATAHCGGCGRACALANASAACASGACAVAACNAGFADCDRAAANGCEVNTVSDNANCGACARACPSGQVCAIGACTFTCPPGQAACSDGCFVLASSTAHCGACERACPDRANATTLCAAGACAFRCVGTFADCDATASNGCEVNTSTAVSDCGGCGMRCALANATPACASGRCDVAACTTGFGDCDGASPNGCEVNLQTAPTHCGLCGRACSVPNATAGCAGGACTVGACNAGFADCDRAVINGCEVNLNTSATHCGACGVSCTASQACVGGACQALASCRAILTAAPSSANGVYTIDPDGAGAGAPLSVLCDMAGGGWTLILMAGTDVNGQVGYNSGYWTGTAVLNETVTDTARNVSMKNRAFNTLGFDSIRFCLGTLTGCMVETITSTSALALFMRGETSRARPPADFAPWGYTGAAGCNRNGFNVFDVGGGPARFRYGILMNNEAACEGSVDGGRGFGGRGYYGTEISGGQGDGIVSTSHERGWVWVR